jgi:diacylglycerol kinase family enzyme
MVLSTLKTLLRRPLIRVQLSFEGQRIRRTTPFVFVGNNQYSLDVYADAKRPTLDAGRLCVMAARSSGPWVLLRLAFQAVVNRLHLSQDFDCWSVRELEIQTHRRSVRVAVDGEVVRMRTPLIYRSRPAALRVFAPAC